MCFGRFFKGGNGMLLSFSPSFIDVNNENGHFTPLHLSFLRAADNINEELFIFNGKETFHFNSEKNVEICKDSDYPKDASDAINHWINLHKSRSKLTIFAYEGSLDLILKLSKVASLNRDVRFFINLMSPEPGLVNPGTWNHFIGTSIKSEHAFKIERVLEALKQNTNIRVSADTEARLVLAKSLGIRIDSVWNGRSVVNHGKQLKSIDIINHKRSESNYIRVLISVDIKRFSFSQLFQCIRAIRFVDVFTKNSATNYLWVFNFKFSELPLHKKILTLLLSRNKTEFIKHKVNLSEYNKRISDSDLIWLPFNSYYVTGSSGRFDDALMNGKPILTRSGTYGDRQLQKWISGYPSYVNISECVQILINLPAILPFLSDCISGKMKEIEEYYSMENQLLSVIGSGEEKKIKIGSFSSYVPMNNSSTHQSNISGLRFISSCLHSLEPKFFYQSARMIILKLKSTLNFNFE